MKTTSEPITWLSGMTNFDHSTRTLLIPKRAPGTLLVSRGSAANIDTATAQITSGRSQIRAFDITAPKQYKYTDGKVIGWGLRNSIGMAEHPIDGGIWSNENGSDDLRRDGVDIHENSPGEEINFHGYMNGTTHPNQGANFGYPNCAAAWNVAGMPRNTELKVGKQFSYAGASGTPSDATCDKNYIAPRLTLPSHWAPIDIAFNSIGTVAYMTSRGSWNKRSPDGYKLFAISFAKGEPVHPPSSTTAAISILSNARPGSCPSGCIRPTGVTFDAKGRLYMASERSREIFVLGRTDGNTVDSVTLETPGSLMAGPRIVKARRSGWGDVWRMFGGSEPM